MRITRSFSLACPLILALAFILVGCSPSTPAPTQMILPTTAPVLATQTAAPTLTPFPTETSRPTTTPSPTQTPLPTATYTPTPDPALAQIKLIGLAWYSNYDMLLSFQFPGPVDPRNYHVKLEDKDYNCEVLAQFPDRLYCRGDGAKVLTTAWVRVYPAGSDQPGFEKKMWIPYFAR